jgi:hypothetical protein
MAHHSMRAGAILAWAEQCSTGYGIAESGEVYTLHSPAATADTHTRVVHHTHIDAGELE